VANALIFYEYYCISKKKLKLFYKSKLFNHSKIKLIEFTYNFVFISLYTLYAYVYITITM